MCVTVGIITCHPRHALLEDEGHTVSEEVADSATFSETVTMRDSCDVYQPNPVWSGRDSSYGNGRKNDIDRYQDEYDDYAADPEDEISFPPEIFDFNDD